MARKQEKTAKTKTKTKNQEEKMKKTEEKQALDAHYYFEDTILTLTPRQLDCYCDNFETITKQLAEKMPFIEAAFQQVDGECQLDAFDIEAKFAFKLKYLKQFVVPLVQPEVKPLTFSDVSLSESEMVWIAKTIAEKQNGNFKEAFDFLTEHTMENVQRRRQLFRSLQGFIDGSYASYNRKNVHSNKVYANIYHPVVK